MLLTAARAAEGRLVIWQAFLAVLVALVIGGIIQFMLVRSAGRRVVYRFGRYIGLTPTRLDAVSRQLQKSGLLGIGIAILTPGVRSVTVTACGLAGLPLMTFALGLTLGSVLFLSLHFFLGYAGRVLIDSLGASLPVVLFVGVVLLIVGFVAWFVIRRRKHPNASTRQIVAETFHAWHEATCPVCLALGAASRIDLDIIKLEHA